MGTEHADPLLANDVEGIHADGKDSREILITHLTTMLESERENSEIIRRKLELIGGAMVALLGFGFFTAQWLYQYPAKSILIWPVFSTIVLHLLLCLVVLFFSWGLFAIYADTKKGHRTANEFLEMKESDIGKPTRRILIGKLSRAYNYLKLRNESERDRLRRVEKRFACGLGLLLLAIFLYLVLSIWQKSFPKEADNDIDAKVSAIVT